MHRIAILGANGQVGAELCLLLSRVPGLNIVPVCRNPTGSAFLRYSGIACRHGRVADSVDAPQLIGDCDVILNCALGAGTPREIRQFDRQLLHNVFKHSPSDAIVIHCSTLMVHGDPRPEKFIRRRDAYGRAKLAAEHCVRRESRRSGKRAYTLRLGHVCGPLQNITHKIRSELAHGTAMLFERDVLSNTVYTATIVDAIRSIIAGKERPGEYDLTNSPQWSWRQVYEFESRAGRVPFTARIVPGPTSQTWMARMMSALRGPVSRWARSPFVRRSLDGWLAMAPAALNARAQAIWFRLRVRAEISALNAGPVPAPELSWVRLDRRSLTSLRPTTELLAGDPYSELTVVDPRAQWPVDLERYVPTPNPRPAQSAAVATLARQRAH
jgi:nucleoside-diphosphate-sugar epimerase